MRTRTLTATVATALAALTPLVATTPTAPAGAAPPPAAPAADLFLSEYIEGTGFNKAIEVANVTGTALDLAAGDDD